MSSSFQASDMHGTCLSYGHATRVTHGFQVYPVLVTSAAAVVERERIFDCISPFFIPNNYYYDITEIRSLKIVPTCYQMAAFVGPNNYPLVVGTKCFCLFFPPESKVSIVEVHSPYSDVVSLISSGSGIQNVT